MKHTGSDENGIDIKASYKQRDSMKNMTLADYGVNIAANQCYSYTNSVCYLFTQSSYWKLHFNAH